MKQQEAIEEYQCSGCVGGPYEKCYKKDDSGIGCGKHCPGTILMGIGNIFLGMPRGYNRLGTTDKIKFRIFKTLKSGWGYDKFNIPVWKYKNEFGHILVRGMSPRTNYTFIHIFLEDCLDEINCLEITKKDLEEMD